MEKITNINTGICHRRIQTGEPAFFVNWKEDNENKYLFHSLRFVIESKKDKLLQLQKTLNKNKPQ